MIDLLERTEAIPASYPAAPSGLTTAAEALDPDMIWQRIEAYVAHRWTDREVTWIVEGAGRWAPDLTPCTITATEVWFADAWAAVEPTPSPTGGYDFAGPGPYRITADVGGGTVPASVNEAFRRLAEYLAEPTDRHGASSYSANIGGDISENYDRNPAWLARAMQYSGAGDLLRSYRRA